MLKKTLSVTLAMLMLACVCWAAAVPGYTAKVVGKMGTMKLSIDCVIQQKVDSDTLKTLGEFVDGSLPQPRQGFTLQLPP